MKRQFGAVLAGCLLAMVLGTPMASASDARIMFSGAVVEPTCSDEVVSIAAAQRAPAPSATGQLRCGRTATDPGRSYSRQVARLTTASLEHDPLLAYYASYAAADGTSVAEVVIHTYD